MSLMTLPWGITEHLGSEAQVAAYLEAVFKVGDPDEVRDAQSHVAEARGITKPAQSTGQPI